MSEKAGLIDWIDTLFKLAIGFFLGLAVGFGIQLFTEVNFWIALVICVGGVLLFYGILALDRLFDGIFDRIFPGWALPPNRRSEKKKSPLFLGRFGVLIGIIAGVLAVFVLPEAWLDGIL